MNKIIFSLIVICLCFGNITFTDAVPLASNAQSAQIATLLLDKTDQKAQNRVYGSSNRIPLGLAIGRCLPVLGLAVFAIGGNDTALHLDRLDVEVVVLGVLDSEPDVLHAVLPVVRGTASLLALPGDAVQDGQLLAEDPLQRGATLPVATQIERPAGL